MNTQPPTYENDKDVNELIYTEITDEKLLSFFFKKGGKVNVTNLSYVVNEYGRKQQIAQQLVNLESAGLITHIEHPMAKVTKKARWIRFRDSKTLITIGVVCGIIAFLIELIPVICNLIKQLFFRQ